jgi:hypothetical protein
MFPELPYEVEGEQKSPSLAILLQQTALFLWKDWPREMQVNIFNVQANTFTLAGICPHCRRDSAFLLVTNVHRVANINWVAGMQCQGCSKFILALVRYQGHNQTVQYLEHYPLGKPDDSVDQEIPEHIQADFKEALRCMWVDAYNATAEMCRRAMEASCLDLGAPHKDVLEDMIDWLADQRKITPSLQEAAHKIRLGGNRGAHPTPALVPMIAATTAPVAPTAVSPAGVIIKIEKEHAEAIVEFTRHFFQYVYVGPKQLAKYDFSKPKAVKP